MSALPAPTVGFLLKRYRRAAGLTQEALAERAQISVDTISDLERGVNLRPRKDTLDQLADALYLSPSERAHLHQVARGVAAPASFSSRLLPAARAGVLPLAGRRQEVAHLARHLAGEGPPLLWLAGEPGIGKSRLLAEAGQRGQEQGWTVLEGGCHRRSGQEPFVPLLTALAGRLHHQAAAQQRYELQGCAWLVRLLPELAEVMPTPTPAWTLPLEQERRLMFAAVARYLANVAGPAGTLLVLDDVQWVGADALDLLVSLLRTPGEPPLRVVGAYRSTEVRPTDPLGVVLADLAAAGLTSEYQVRPLAPSEASELLTSVLEGEQNPDSALREQILSRTGGVPYFLVSCAEALRMSAHEGHQPQDVPWNVTQSIRQRVAALPAIAQDLLGAAAVVGREVPGALLLAVAAHPPAAAVVALEELDQARLLVERAEAIYQFPHDLIREVVLSDLSTLRQRHYHRQVAEALEQGPGEAPVERLAYHYVRAEATEKAILYLERAGDRARALYAYAEAERYYRELVPLLEPLGRPLAVARVREKRGSVLHFLARYGEERTELEQVAEAYRLADDLEGLARVTFLIASAAAVESRPHHWVARVEALLEVFRERAPAPALGWLYTTLADVYETAGRYRESLAAAEQAEALLNAVEADKLLWHTVRFLRGGALFNVGRLVEAAQVLEGTLSEAWATGHLREVMSILSRLALVAHARGVFEQERVYLQRAVEVAETTGNQLWIALMLSQQGSNAFDRGNWVEAQADLLQALPTLRQAGAAYNVAQVLCALGRWAEAAGQREAAEQYLQEAITLSELLPDLLTQCQARSILAEGQLLEGQPQQDPTVLGPLLNQMINQGTDVTGLLPLLAWTHLVREEESRAEAVVHQAIAQARTQQMRPALTNALRIQALLRLQQARWEEAQQALEEAVRLCQTMPYPYAEAKALYVYGLLHRAKGEPLQARERLEAALTILHRLGERLYAEQVEQALATLEQHDPS